MPQMCPPLSVNTGSARARSSARATRSPVGTGSWAIGPKSSRSGGLVGKAGSGPPGAPGGVGDAAEQVRPERGVRVRLPDVAESGVPGAAAVVLVRPGEGVVRAHAAALVRPLVHREEDVDRA